MESKSDIDFRAIVDISPYPIFIHKNGLVKYVNDLVPRMLRVPDKLSLKGKSLATYIHPEDQSLLAQAVQRGETLHTSDVFDFRIVDAAGNVKLIQSKSTSITYGGERCRLVFIYNYDEVEQARSQLAEKDMLLSKLVEIMPISFLVVNSVTRNKLFENKSLIGMLGYTEDDVAQYGDEFNLVGAKIHHDDLEKMFSARAFLSQKENQGLFFTTEYRILDKQNRWRWILGQSCNIRIGDGGVGSINFGIVQDVTEQKKKEQELAEYRQFQEKINSISPVIVTVFDLVEMTSTYRSKDMAQWFGYSEHTFPAKTLHLVHPDYRQDTIDALNRLANLANGEIQNTVFPFVMGDGSIKFILTRSTVFHRDENGKVTEALLVHSDITDLKEIESKLDKSEETRKAILYAIPDMVFTVDTKGVIVDFYPGEFQKELLESLQLVGKDVKEIISKDKYEAVKMLIQQTAEKKIANTLEFDQQERDFTYYYELRISPFTDTEVIIVVRDITDLKASQRQLDHYNKELYGKNQELERYITSNSELEKFAYIASHDLREPLRSLTGFAQLLQKRNMGNLSLESEEFIDNIIQGAQRMNTLVNGLLEYSRIATSGKPFTTVNLMHLIKKVKSDLKVNIEETDTELVVFDLPEINCDELQMRQLIQNLISNAIKFRGDRAPIIKVSSEENESYWKFKIEDNGIGLDMRYKEQVFQIFTRLHSQEQYQGSGIGLSVCKKIVERHGGRIWLESTVGKGTSVYFTVLM